MNTYTVTLSKGTATYEIEAENEDLALEQAEEWYNERDIDSFHIEKTESPRYITGCPLVPDMEGYYEWRNGGIEEFYTVEDAIKLFRNMTKTGKTFILDNLNSTFFVLDGNSYEDLISFGKAMQYEGLPIKYQKKRNQ